MGVIQLVRADDSRSAVFIKSRFGDVAVQQPAAKENCAARGAHFLYTEVSEGARSGSVAHSRPYSILRRSNDCRPVRGAPVDPAVEDSPQSLPSSATNSAHVSVVVDESR